MRNVSKFQEDLTLQQFKVIQGHRSCSSQPLITTHSIYSTASYHHRQLLLKATTSGRELITDRYRTVLDIS